MAQMVPLNKRSKKEQKEYHAKQRGSWYGLNPIIALLWWCSNNLNQYARRANETGSIYTGDIEDLQNRLDGIWGLSRQSLA